MSVIITLHASVAKNMILRFAFLFLTIFSLSMAPSAFGQDIEASSISVDLSVDLKAFPELVSPEDIQVFLNDERLKTGKINADTLVTVSYTHLTLPTKRIV